MTRTAVRRRSDLTGSRSASTVGAVRTQYHRKVTTRRESKKRGGEMREYTAPQIVLSGDLLLSAGIKAGDEVNIERVRDGQITISRDDTPRKSAKRR